MNHRPANVTDILKHISSPSTLTLYCVEETWGDFFVQPCLVTRCRDCLDCIQGPWSWCGVFGSKDTWAYAVVRRPLSICPCQRESLRLLEFYRSCTQWSTNASRLKLCSRSRSSLSFYRHFSIFTRFTFPPRVLVIFYFHTTTISWVLTRTEVKLKVIFAVLASVLTA